MAGGVEFELSIEVLQAFEFTRVKDERILCSGTSNEGYVTDSGSSRTVFFKGGLKVPLLSGASEKRATENEIISSERGSPVEVFCGKCP
jgi:hypothetical protein